MKKIFCSFALATAFAISVPAAEFKFGHQILKVPDGFEVELVSTTNLVMRPVSMDFDELGRLYVTDSSGSSEKGPTQYEKRDHRVMRLEDTNGDGKFDKSTVFADNMMFPEGCMYYDGSVYVAAPPSIWKLTDTNNDGVADVRVEWFQGKTLTGCANDLHGPNLGPDGMIYWCKGAFAEQTHQVNGKPFTSRAAHIWRARPDGSGMEPVMTGGMDNPTAVGFNSVGERFLAGTFFEPRIPGQRDGVLHAIYGGVYGKQNAALDGHKRTGELMPVMTPLGASASCSVIFYRSKIFGEEFYDNMFVANFNLHNVTRHILEPNGATYKTKDSVFLSCDNDPDFHPTHVLEDADGSLLVIDTGGWYKICCPTSQLYKPDVLGAIYRIKKVGAKKVEDPRGLKIDWVKAKPDELTKFLSDERPYVAERAIQVLAKKGDEAVPALRKILSSAKEGDFKAKAKDKIEWIKEYSDWLGKQIAQLPYNLRTRQNAIWTLTRINSSNAREAVREGLFDLEEEARLAAYNSISLHRDSAGARRAIDEAHELMSLREWRSIFEVIGRTRLWNEGDEIAWGVKMNFDVDAARMTRNRVLQHSFIYSLIESEATNAAAFFVKQLDLMGEALIALDQMGDGYLKPEQVAPLLLSTYSGEKETASWIVSRHPEWGDALTGFFLEALNKKEISPAGQIELQKQLAELSSNASIQELLATTLQSESKNLRSLVLKTIAQSDLKTAPGSWTTEITKILGGKELIAEAIAAAKAVPASKEKSAELSEALLKVARDKSQSDDLRLNALAALPNVANIGPALFDFLIANLDSTKPVLTRGAATAVLTRGRLSREQLLALADALKFVGPMEVMKLLNAFEKPAATNEIVGTKLAAALKEAKTFSTMRVERLKPLFEKYPAAVQAQAETLYLSLNVDAEKQSKHVDELVVSLQGGDIRRGQAIFNSERAACASCHAIGHAGGKVGPDLTKIGQVRTERDLIEAIVYPSASFVRSYEPMFVATKDGEDYSGVLKKDGDDEIILATGPNSEVRIQRAEITEMRPGTLSTMPAGLDEQLSKEEMADLIAFLKATRW